MHKTTDVQLEFSSSGSDVMSANNMSCAKSTALPQDAQEYDHDEINGYYYTNILLVRFVSSMKDSHNPS